MAHAIHREHFFVTMFKKEIGTTKELDLKPLGKVIIFRDKQTDRTFLLYIDHYHQEGGEYRTVSYHVGQHLDGEGGHYCNHPHHQPKNSLFK